VIQRSVVVSDKGSSSINNNNHQSKEEIKLQSQRFDIFKGLPFWISGINRNELKKKKT
jgi:hypothetical protein